MKKFLLVSLLLAFVFSCRKDVEQPQLPFHFSVNHTEKTAEIGVNETTKLDFEIKSEYKFSSVPMKFKIIGLNTQIGSLNFNNQAVEENKEYEISQENFSFFYTGRQEGNHKFQLLLFNDKGFKQEKEVSLNFARFGFSVQYFGGNTEIYQGQNVDYKLVITPEKQVADTYQIRFKSFDEQDPAMQKSYVLLNGNRINFEHWYDIADLNNVPVIINSHHFGSKKLVYEIKNVSSVRSFEIDKSFKQRSVNLENFVLNKTETDRVRENIVMTGFVKKITKTSSKIYYKTWITENINTDGIQTTNNVYKEFSLSDNNQFSLHFETLKEGKYVLNLIMKDEFENESSPISFTIDVYNKDFTIEQIGDLGNLMQGQNFNLRIKVKESRPTTSVYQIKFISFDTSLNSKITLNNEEIPLNVWKTIDKEISLTLNSFTSGNKVFQYEIKNEVTSKQNITNLQIRSEKIEITNFSVNKTNFDEGETLSLQGSIQRNVSDNRNLKYKIWLTKGSGIDNTDNYYKSITVGSSNEFKFEFPLKNAGAYTMNIQFMDEFGNESAIKTIDFNVNTILNLDISHSKIFGNISYTFGNIANGRMGQYFGVFDVKASSGQNNDLYKIDFYITYSVSETEKKQIHREVFLGNIKNYNQRYIFEGNSRDWDVRQIRDVKYKIILHDNKGKTIQINKEFDEYELRT